MDDFLFCPLLFFLSFIFEELISTGLQLPMRIGMPMMILMTKIWMMMMIMSTVRSVEFLVLAIPALFFVLFEGR